MNFKIKVRDLAAAVLTAGKQQSRYYLCGVYIHTIEGKIVLASTDGHCLIQIKTGEKAPEDFKPFIMPTDAIKTALGIAKAKKSETLTFDGLVVDGYAFNKIDGTYPDYARVIPQRLEEGNAIDFVGINGLYIGEIQKAINIHAGIKNQVMKLEFCGTPKEPIRIYGAAGFFGVVMPMRVE